MESLDAILELLSDGKWHTINELSTEEPLRKLSITTLAHFLNFLAEYDFIELSFIIDAKLTPPMHEFMKKIQWIERSEEAIAEQNTENNF